MKLTRLPVSLFAACLGAALASPPAVAAPDQAQRTEDLRPARTGMYSTYVDTRSGFFDDDLRKPYPMPMDALLPALLDAVDRMSKYSVPKQAPPVQRVPHEIIEQLACGGAKCAALAAYRSGEGIYIDESLKPETDVFARSVLLHELIHYVQDVSNELASAEPCNRWYRREQEAYAIQKRFLMLAGSQVRVGYAGGARCDAGGG